MRQEDPRTQHTDPGPAGDFRQEEEALLTGWCRFGSEILSGFEQKRPKISTEDGAHGFFGGADLVV